MADIRVSLGMLDDRNALAAEQRKHLANPSVPTKTTRAIQRQEDPSINPLDVNIMTVGQVLMGATTQVSPETFIKTYMDIAAEGLSHVFDGGEEKAAGEKSLDSNIGREGVVATGTNKDAESRGWGSAPVPRDLIVDVRAGTNNVRFPGGVHEKIVPLVVALVEQVEAATGELAKSGWCWGYAARKIRGGSSWSNHAWGLAIDFNAPDHPLGAEGTWGSDGPEISRIANNLGFRWGGDYNGRKDDMHFEFMGTPEDVDRLLSQDDVIEAARIEGSGG